MISSTLFNFSQVKSGTLLIDVNPLGSFGHKKRAREIAYLPQSYTAANMDVFTLVSHGRFPYLGFSKVLGKKDLELIENALRLTDLWQIKDKNLSEISGGQRQRAYLAMAIAEGNPAQLAAGTELRQSMGIGLKNCGDQDSLYKYNLIKA